MAITRFARDFDCPTPEFAGLDDAGGDGSDVVSLPSPTVAPRAP